MGKGGGSAPKIPKAPKIGKSYQQGINVYLRNLPRMLQAEQGARNQYDTQRVAEQQKLQDQYGPHQYEQESAAVNALDPALVKAHNDLGAQVTGDLALGSTLDPASQNQVQQYVRGAQSARGNVFGDAAGAAEAYALGDRGQQLKQQRIQNAGNFTQTPSLIQQAGMVAPVSPDRSSAYVNPNAGYQGLQAAQQNYANQVGAATAGSSGGGGGGWGTALSTIGSIVGAVGMFASDRRVKKDIQKVGTGPKGVGIYEFNYKKPPFAESENHDASPRYRGVIAQDVQNKIPGAVSTNAKTGMKAVDYAKVGVPMRRVS